MTAPRIDRGARLFRATAADIYRTFTDPAQLMRWLPPKGMRGRVETFEPRPGGSFRFVLTYLDPDPDVRGKTSADEDVVVGRFLDLVPDRLVVMQIEFASEDPAFAGAMTLRWALVSQAGGTEVTVTCTDVPAGIARADHEAGLASSLANLAALVE